MPATKPSKQRNRRGRPSKKTPQTVRALLQAIRTGAPYTICCAAVGIEFPTFLLWKKNDPVFAAQVEQTSAKTALRLLGKIEAHARETFAAAAWLLERRYPSDFSRPEVQLNLIQQNNTTENHLSITITAGESREIEAIAEPVRESVRKMFEGYKPQGLGNGDGEKQGQTVEVEASVVQEPFRHQAGDEKNQAFWRTLVSSEPQREVAKATAIFAIGALLLQTQGLKAHRAEIEFDHDPITVEELFGTLERLCGGASGWQCAQKLGGY